MDFLIFPFPNVGVRRGGMRMIFDVVEFGTLIPHWIFLQLEVNQILIIGKIVE